MGMKTLEAKKQELRKQEGILQQFVDDVTTLNRAMEKLNKKSESLMRAQEDLFKVYQQVGAKAESMDTGGEPLFAAYQAKLVKFCNEPFAKPNPPKPDKLSGVVAKYRKSVDDEFANWVSKQEASWPKEIKKGMCFKWYVTGDIYEVLSDAKQASNVNLKGDDAIYWDVRKMGASGKFALKKSEMNPKKKWKYIKS